MKHYEIAGLRVAMAVSGRTQKQAAAYAAPAEGEPCVILPDNAESVLRRFPELNDLDTAQYMGTGASFARLLLEHDGFQLHASSVILNNGAYLFSAPSGTGKSTHTEKWVRLFGARYLNDDKPAIRLVDGKWMAYGTPWSGKHDLSSPESAPVRAFVFVKRGEKNAVEALAPDKAVPYLLSQVSRAYNLDCTEQLIRNLDHFLRTIPAWLLICNKDDEAAYLSHNVLCGAD